MTQATLDFDGRYRVEQRDGTWYLCGPAFCSEGRIGMSIPASAGDDVQLIAKYRDLADLLNAVVDAERRR